MPKPMIHSYSSLSTWRQCPRLHKAQYVDKILPYVESPAMKRGNDLHKKMERVFTSNAPVPAEYKGKEKFIRLMQHAGGNAEMGIGLTRDLTGCGFFDNKHVWLRGKIDLHVALLKLRAAIMVDWKTGNPNFTDELQADVYTAMICSITQLERVLFVWSYFTGEYKSVLVTGKAAVPRVTRLIASVEADTKHPPRPGWKCRYCGLKTCEYNETED